MVQAVSIDPSEAVMYVVSIGFTRLCLVTPRVYHIHHSFLGVYLLLHYDYSLTLTSAQSEVQVSFEACAKAASDGYRQCPISNGRSQSRRAYRRN